MDNFNAPQPVVPVIALDAESRGTFIAKTYAHVFGAILLFAGIEAMLFASGLAESITNALGGSWLIVLGAFVLVSWFATRTAHTARSLASQYIALFGYVVVWALIFVPILYIAEAQAVARGSGNVITSAAISTLVGFAGLTLIAFGTRKDFSFLRGILMWVGVSAILLILSSIIFGFSLGAWFSVAMIIFAGAAILYDTSKIIHHYPQDRYVGAALELFGSVAMMFWYVLRLFMSRD